MEQQKLSLYSPEVYRQSLGRIGKLTPDTQPKWGKMSVAQMLAHCSDVLDVANGKSLEDTPFIVMLFKRFVRKMVVSDKPYPKSTQTHPQYKQNDPRDFASEKQRLLKTLENFVNMDRQKAVDIEHPLFGKMSLEEKGWMNYKHLDHHLTQFGV